MVMGSFNHWLGFVFLSYVMFVPVINTFLAPILSIGVANGWFRPISWRRYLIANGSFYVFAIWFPFFAILDFFEKLEKNISLYEHIPYYVIFVGIMTQGIFFLIWLVSYLRKKAMPDSYYRIWTAGFILLYLLPFVIHMTIFLFK